MTTPNAYQKILFHAQEQTVGITDQTQAQRIIHEAHIHRLSLCTALEEMLRACDSSEDSVE